jgi:hypothetical protein
MENSEQQIKSTAHYFQDSVDRDTQKLLEETSGPEVPVASRETELEETIRIQRRTILELQATILSLQHQQVMAELQKLQ